ncbi:MAG: B12-binding domain-containing radical SAM protein [Thermodesulfobacteriota bacterium]
MKPRSRRLLLVEPPFYRLFDERYSLCRYPLALGYLAAAAAGAGWRARAYNADFAGPGRPLSVRHLAGDGHRRYLACLADAQAPIWQEVEAVVRAEAPAVVGVSLKSACLASGRRVAAIAKRLDPGALVLAGGPHPSAAPEQVLADANFDLCVIGEGERTLAELLRCLEAGGDLRQAPGLAFRGEGGVVRTAPRPLMPGLEGLPRPLTDAARVLVDHDRYPARALGHVMATRGCPQRCAYCGSHGLWGRRPRLRPPGEVTAELAAMRAAGVERVHFDDDTFGVTPAYLESLCAALAKGVPGLAWSCETHVRLIDQANLERMQAAGCRTIQLGVESGSDRILAAVGKGFTVAQALAACRLVKRQGLRLEVFIMAGFPQETEASLRETIAVAADLDCDKVIYSLFTPHPGTEAHRLCLSLGLVDPDQDFSPYHHQSPRNHYCPAIAPGRFRELAAELEDLADRRRPRP